MIKKRHKAYVPVPIVEEEEEEEEDGTPFLFRFRFLGISPLGMFANLYEVGMIVILLLSICNIALTLPTIWVYMILWIALIVFTTLAFGTQLSVDSRYTLLARQQQNDAMHFWALTGLHLIVGAFAALIYFLPAAGTLPLDPMTEIYTFLGQQLVFAIVITACMTLLGASLCMNVEQRPVTFIKNIL